MCVYVCMYTIYRYLSFFSCMCALMIARVYYPEIARIPRGRVAMLERMGVIQSIRRTECPPFVVFFFKSFRKTERPTFSIVLVDQ